MNMSEFDRAGVVPKRIAVIGGGIAGLASAWLLSRRHRVTLFEAGDYVGGHTNTIDIAVEGHRHPIDTGFLVFNDRTYPNLCALFACLGVASVESEMSFGVSLAEPEIEWAGSDLGTVFAQRSNLLRPAFLGMLSDILRFNRETTRMAAEGDAPPVSLGDYLAAGRYGSAFRDWYLLPMASAIWSCPTRTMLDYPLATFARFCHNHGLLQIFDRPRWRTVAGGGREYVRRILDELDDVQVATPVLGVDRRPDGVWLRCRDGAERFDEVVFACHSDQTLAILGAGASLDERRILGAVKYQPNLALVHTDTALLPRRRKVWSAWNYLAGAGRPDERPVSVSYLINRLQPLPFETPVVVSLNPFTEPARDKLIRRIEYAHPVFDQAAVDAQAALPTIQGRQRSWFAGAWTGYGFHEDGLKSALVVARALGAEIPWQPSAEAAPASLLREAA
ncbi:NAD/FAD-binding protein [Zoogloea ramigera]|jgi:predicted NAD/FAD-binding protein|uniref:NAD/FAD-binding protein n=1 Tax=Zoogloea ramigera TaxID=350 RepID=A0A4Y4CP85_ZOORA|nr:FAD-dependent oxidoreductase [Zoogloea ramigera]MBP6801288.1 FAD-dependent oxidoreductase [Zoogloea sp.]GEC94761.1 NAD/FAD-binding protein [Zoogloea ramigera]